MNTDILQQLPVPWVDTAQIFTALGDPHRQRLLLLFEPGERLSIRQLVAVSPLSRTAVTHHLKILRETGLLLEQKEGKTVYLTVNTARLLETFAVVTDFVRDYVQQTEQRQRDSQA
ncbi:ArsR/SmtB family transcription factor [Halothiobacillus sp. DCM-1]|uniref:ArsR/SmtB family transcription factor n=1 Tax=Halothiobacillus sp. DCM-1 TaxID=3112558 RepID=UPI00324A821F